MVQAGKPAVPLLKEGASSRRSGRAVHELADSRGKSGRGHALDLLASALSGETTGQRRLDSPAGTPTSPNATVQPPHPVGAADKTRVASWRRKIICAAVEGAPFDTAQLIEARFFT